MINQILVYTLSNLSAHPMTILENIDILSLTHFFILLMESPAYKESFDVSITKIPAVLQFQKCRRKLLNL